MRAVLVFALVVVVGAAVAVAVAVLAYRVETVSTRLTC